VIKDSAKQKLLELAYGARLESVLSASSHGFESRILRQIQECIKTISKFKFTARIRPETSSG